MFLCLPFNLAGSAYAESKDAETTIRGKIIRVPQDKQSIQAAIDAAHDSDTVLVYPGIYSEAITLDRKNITLASRFLKAEDENDIVQTILDGTVTHEYGSSKKGSFVIKIEIRLHEYSGPVLSIFGKDGGFQLTVKDGVSLCMNSIHYIWPMIPVENLVVLFDAVNDYRSLS